MTGISNRFLKLSDGLETVGGEIWANPLGVRSFGVSLLLVIKPIRRMYIYTQTMSVRNTIAKKGLKIAFCMMSSSSGFFRLIQSSVGGRDVLEGGFDRVKSIQNVESAQSVKSWWKTFDRENR